MTDGEALLLYRRTRPPRVRDGTRIERILGYHCRVRTRANTVDEELLKWCGGSDRVLVTNDRDFVELDERVDHAGLVIYTSQAISPSDFARAIRRVDRQFEPKEMREVLVWLDQWL